MIKSEFPVTKNEFFDSTLLDKWRAGDYSMLTRSGASEYIKKILLLKAQERPGRRFFGEAYVSSVLYRDMQDGWYNSFKWLTKDKWLNGQGLEPAFEKPFYDALMTNIGYAKLTEIQKAANTCSTKIPVAPDLWFINKKGGFDFVEVKLPGDKVADHQLAGMSILQDHLKACSISIVSLTPRHI